MFSVHSILCYLAFSVYFILFVFPSVYSILFVFFLYYFDFCRGGAVAGAAHRARAD